MPRKPRYSRPGRVYHLISRLVDREWFVKDEADRRLYIDLLGRALASTDWRSLGYAVMSNHFHHGVIAGHEDLDGWIRRVHSPFADAMNKKYGRIGPVFVRGPKQLPVYADGVAALLAYIHNNPVRAGVSANASSSTWTSHQAYLGITPARPWLHVEEGLALAGFVDASAFDDYVRIRATDKRHDPCREQRLIRDDEEHLEFHEVARTRVVTAVDIVAATANVLGVEPDFLRSRRRTRLHVLARHAACVVADRLHVAGSSIAIAAGLSAQGVSFILNRTPSAAVEDVADAVLAELDSSLTDRLSA